MPLGYRASKAPASSRRRDNALLCFEIYDGRRARNLSREPGLDGVAIRGRDIDGWPESLSRITWSRSHNQGLSSSFALVSAFLHSLCLPPESSASACVTTIKICAWACFFACSTDSRVGWCSSCAPIDCGAVPMKVGSPFLSRERELRKSAISPAQGPALAVAIRRVEAAVDRCSSRLPAGGKRFPEPEFLFERIKARAIDRCGELYRQIPAEPGKRTDVEPTWPRRDANLGQMLLAGVWSRAIAPLALKRLRALADAGLRP